MDTNKPIRLEIDRSHRKTDLTEWFFSYPKGVGPQRIKKEGEHKPVLINN